MEKIMIGFAGGCYTLMNMWGKPLYTFSAGDVFFLLLGEKRQAVTLKSGGYKGWYYITAEGERGRLALGMQAYQKESETDAS